MKTILPNQNVLGKNFNPPARPNLQRAFDLCAAKTRENIKRLADEPKTAAIAVDGNYFSWKEGFYEIGNWTSSFFTGMALLAWQETEDEFYLNQVLRLAPHYREKVFKYYVDTMHDLGFLYSLYSVALYKLTHDKEHREVGLRAAEVLAGRFIPSVPDGGYIRAWGRMDEQDTEYAGLAIIDCMMNLPLLYWAAKESGNKRYSDIAICHANTTLKCFVRADDSVFHSYRFDLKTGKPAHSDNYCGRSIESQWARGTAWAIYGFALSYSYTRDAKYLETSLRLARKFVAKLDEEAVPIWDFKLAAGEKPVRDSSAAAVAACGIQELAKHHVADASLLIAKEALLDRLCSNDYLDSNMQCPGILKNGQIGDGVGVAKNAYTSWGDYYLMEAVTRELFEAEIWW
ncbi:MAG TPA: glycoside hydrolase family 88 protein [Verrucomicrobiae bacterium]